MECPQLSWCTLYSGQTDSIKVLPCKAFFNTIGLLRVVLKCFFLQNAFGSRCIRVFICKEYSLTLMLNRQQWGRRKKDGGERNACAAHPLGLGLELRSYPREGTRIWFRWGCAARVAKPMPIFRTILTGKSNNFQVVCWFFLIGPMFRNIFTRNGTHFEGYLVIKWPIREAHPCISYVCTPIHPPTSSKKFHDCIVSFTL